MNREDSIEAIKSKCSERGLAFIIDITVGNSVLILVKDNPEMLGIILTELGIEHTTPAKIADGIGSYITIS